MGGKEVLPNPSDTLQSLRYAQDQARHFKDHPSAHHVLLYLVMNMWVRVPNKENAGIGEVMYGRASIECIAENTALSRSTVKRAMRWLAEELWIDTDRAYADTGREDKRYITVLLDTRAGRERDRIRQAGEAAERILAGT